MSKGNVVTLAIVLALVGGIIFAACSVAYSVWDHSDPVYQGKRVFTWVDQAIRDEDPAARRRAADVLVAALREMQGDIRNQVIMRFIGAPSEKRPLPKEVLPVLLESLRFKEIHIGGYTAMAFRHGDP